MSKHIFEEQGGPHRGHAAGDTDVEKAASQLASDVRYKVKQKMGKGTNLNPAQVSKAYLAQLAKSPASPAVKTLAKKKILGEEYTSDIKDLVEKTLVNALVQVFTEESEEKVWIVVTDKKTGNTYRRQATRAKISELRSNPNISRVEITNYHPNEDDDKGGQKTAKVKAGKGLNNDGNLANNYPPYDKVTRGDVIAGSTGKDQMGGKKKFKEEFIGEVKEKSETKNKKITGENVNNYSGKDSVVKLFPKIEEEIKPSEMMKPSQQKPQQQNQSAINQVLMAKQKADVAQRELAMKQRTASQKGVNLTSLSASYQPEGEVLDEKITANTDMGAAITDFQQSKSPQLSGRSKEKRREAAIAAVLTARRGGKKLGEEASRDDEKTKIDAEDPRSIPTKVNLIKNKLRSAGVRNPIVMVATEECETIDELNRYERETGKDYKTGKSVTKGGTMGGDDTNSKVMRHMNKVMGAGRMGAGGPIQKRGEKKEPGKKPPEAGKYGSERRSPEQIVKNRRATKQQGRDNMSSRFD
jgi:hypothetical protein